MKKNKLIYLVSGILLLGSILLYNDGINEKLPNKDVLFFIPHQDDEVLSFSSTIKKYMNKGYNVNVVLSTDGSGEGGTRKNLNGENGQACKIHKYVHNPTKENYKIDDQNADYITPEILSKYRNEEYVNALLELGLNKESIHISRYTKGDGYLTKDNAIDIIVEYLRKYPTATVHTFYDKKFSNKNHPDHMNLGKGAVELFDEGVIEKLYLHIEPYVYSDFIKSGLGKNTIIDKAKNKEDKETIVKAMNEYDIWEPEKGKLAIGYHSVKPYLDKAKKDTLNYRIEYKTN